MRRTTAASIVGGGVTIAVAASIAFGGSEEPAHESATPPPPAGPIVPGGSEVPRGAGLHIVEADGRGLRRVNRDDGSFFRSPAWAPDGKRLAAIVTVPPEQPLPRAGLTARFEILDLRGRLVRRFEVRGYAGGAAWSPDSKRLAYVVRDPVPRARGGLAAQLTVAEVGSGRTRVVSKLARVEIQARPDWSPDGRLIAFPSLHRTRIPGASTDPVIEQPEISVVRPDGRGERRLTRDPKRYRQPAGSDEEGEPLWLGNRRVFYVSLTTPPDPAASRRLRVIDARGGRPRDLTGINYAVPSASRDGRRIALTGSTPEAPRLRLYSLDVESGELTTLVNENVVGRPSWSPDGKLIAFALGDRVEAIRPDGSGRRVVVRLPGREIREVAWSPDGRRIAFTTGATRRVPTPPSP